MKSHLTDDFLECFAKLPGQIKRLAGENYKLWSANPYHPSLSFKWVGKKYPAYSVRVGLGWRQSASEMRIQSCGSGSVHIRNMKE